MKNGQRIVYFVCEDFKVEGRGYRASIVKEGERGHYPTGTWPYTGAVGESLPYFWGPTLADAQERAEYQNARMGIDATEAALIVAGSMA